MSALEDIIRSEIAASGPMPLDRYMALCLGHPEHGYYMAKPAIGAAGDFTTAPEISQMFGEIIGAVLAHQWQTMGAPAPVRVIELGPGRATLILDILRTFKVVPGLLDAPPVPRPPPPLHLVETSPRLRRAQDYRLRENGFQATWHEAIDAVPEGPALVVANEFFDALPIRQRIRRGGSWHDRRIGIDADGDLVFVAGPQVADTDVPEPLREAGDDAILEDCPAACQIAGAIGARFAATPGTALFIDYGYRTQSHGDSLQALRGKAYADPLRAPGEADLTAHVDFSALDRAASGAGARTWGPITQGTFSDGARYRAAGGATARIRRRHPGPVTRARAADRRRRHGNPVQGSGRDVARTSRAATLRPRMTRGPKARLTGMGRHATVAS